MIRRIGDIFAKALDRADYLTTLARLSILDWLAGASPEAPTDTAIREHGERMPNAFPLDRSGSDHLATALFMPQRAGCCS
jgi:hypothetical protein